MNLHKFSLIVLYSLTVIATLYLAGYGFEYYGLSLQERPHSDLHLAWKPSGFIGQGAGIVGSALMLILLLYSLRKRMRFMQQGWGDIRYWLNYHIWMGITGPVLVIFHTTFKFGGIVAVSFWSMMAVALSGVLGRYIYVQIPRSLSGEELSASELQELEETYRRQLSSEASGNPKALPILDHFIETNINESKGLMSWLTHDMTATFRYNALKQQLMREAGLSGHDAKHLVDIARRRATLERRVAFLGHARKLLHHWHVFHKPFAIIMIVIMVVHITVAVSLGYTWIF